MPRIVRTNTCSRCKHSELETGGRYCHMVPPVSSPIIVPLPEPPGFKVGFFTCWPVVKDDEWCAQWKPQVEIAATLPEAVQRGVVSIVGRDHQPQPAGKFVDGAADG